MAKRVLVPLDGSLEAEQVIALVADLARGGASVRLLHVAPLPDNVMSDGRIVAYADQEGARIERQMEDYLRVIEAQLVVTAECVVRFGDPVREILEEAVAFDADLIVVSTKTANGIRRLVFGSVADRVLRKARAAVMLYRPGRAA